MQTCFFCKGNMKDGYNNYMTEIDGHFFIIKNVPCHICEQCGEVSYSGQIVARIEEMIEGLKGALNEVEITEFVA